MPQIAIIGAGPVGLAALKTVLDTHEHKTGLWSATAFEAREHLGGVWSTSAQPPIPPIYDSLTTNLPHPIMGYSGFPFPASTPLYPKADVVQRYLEAYATHFELRSHIRVNSKVVRADWDGPKGKWMLEVEYFAKRTNFEADLLLVCNGHHNIPRYPKVPGLHTWDKRLISHSMTYRRPSPDYGHTILVVGGGPSGQDIVSDLLSSSYIKKIIHSTSSPSRLHPSRLQAEKLVVKPRLAQFNPPECANGSGSVTFEDGTRETGITHCILATGYEVSLPFHSESFIIQGTPPPQPKQLYNTSYSLFPLFKHLTPFPTSYSRSLPPFSQPFQAIGREPHDTSYFAPPTSIAFLGLLVRVAPLPLALSQARAALAAFRHGTQVNWAQGCIEVADRWESLQSGMSASRDTVLNPPSDESYVFKQWHRFEPMEQYDYRDDLDAFADELDLESSLNTHRTPLSATSRVPCRVKAWERHFYTHKDLLRRTWQALEASGEADAWIKGVGADPGRGVEEQWVDFMQRVLVYGEKIEGGARL